MNTHTKAVNVMGNMENQIKEHTDRIQNCIDNNLEKQEQEMNDILKEFDY